MKNEIITLIVILFSVTVFCQEQGNITGKFYITDIDIVVEEFNLIKNIGTSVKFVANKNTKYTAYEIKDNKLLIKFWKYTGNEQSETVAKNTDGGNENYKYISEETNNRYFIMDLVDFNNKTTEYFGTNHSFVWGFSLLPIKLRFSDENRPFNYETGFSLGTNAGYEYQIPGRSKKSLGVLIGVGISTVALTPETVNDYIDKDITVGAFTPSLGLIFSYENFQIGVFSGYDIIPGELGRNWQYSNSPWLGLGLGFTIFQKNKTANSTDQEQKGNKD